jgi:predicted secreted protein
MATQRGIEMIIQKPVVGPPAGWANVCGIATTNFKVMNQIIETKKAVCDDRTLPPVITRKYGSQDISFSGSGVFEDDANGVLLADACVNQTVLTGYRVLVPGYGTFTGDWLVPSGDFSGDLDNDLQFAAEVQASGDIVFAVLP